MNRLDGSGLIFSVDDHACEVSGMGYGDNTDAHVTDSDDGASGRFPAWEARQCAGEPDDPCPQQKAHTRIEGADRGEKLYSYLPLQLRRVFHRFRWW